MTQMTHVEKKLLKLKEKYNEQKARIKQKKKLRIEHKIIKLRLETYLKLKRLKRDKSFNDIILELMRKKK